MTNLVYDNIVFSLQKFGGISTYWFELSKRMLVDPDFKPLFVTEVNRNILARELEIPVEVDLVANRFLPLLVRRFINPSLNDLEQPFVFHSSYNRVSVNKYARNITTVHDLIHHKYYSGIRQWLHNKQKDVALKRSSAIICVSKNTRNDLLTYFPYLNPDIIKIVHNGVSDDFFLLANDHPYEISEEILNSNYLLSISSREHYKNFWFTVQLAAKLPDFKLYIVGPKLNSKEVQLLNENLPNRWKLFSSINNLKLNELYNHAYALIYPSSYEGFGIPLLEAMKAKCPFIALNTSSIPEVAGDAGILIDELDIEEFVKAVECLGNYRADLIIKGDLQVGNFSWDKCYLETKEVYINSLR